MDLDAAQALSSAAVAALQKHEHLVESLDDHRLHSSLKDEIRDDLPSARAEALRALATVRRLAELVEGAPDPSLFVVDERDGLRSALDAALELDGLLSSYDELEQLRKSTAPALSTDSLHRWVWKAAEELWINGHHRAAVHAAASQVERHLQAKINRPDVSGSSLVEQAFSLKEPEEGHKRLRFRGSDSTAEQYKNEHTGAMDFGKGITKTFRNTSAHDPLRPLSKKVALEQLAAFSVFARMIDIAEVEPAGEQTVVLSFRKHDEASPD